MQAIIMAAGKGSRLGEITSGKPKSFMNIKGYRLIDYILALLRHHNVKPITIVTGYCCEQIEAEFGKDPDIELVFNPFYEQTNVLGSFWAGMHRLNEEFLFIHADSICDPGLFDELVNAGGDLVLPVDYDTYNEESMGVRLENGHAVEISKEIPVGEAIGEFIGFAKISKSALSGLKNEVLGLMKDKQFLAFFEAALQGLMDRRQYEVVTLPTKGRFWAEIDFIEDYEEAAGEMPDSLVALAEAHR